MSINFFLCGGDVFSMMNRVIPEPLQKFYNLTLTDPLFAAEGLDLDNTRWALEDLRKLANDLEREYRKQYWWFCFRYPFVETLHPIRFLERFIDCERSRRLFLYNPIMPNAQDLIRSYQKTLAALGECARAHREALIAAKNAEPFPENAIFHFISESFSFSDMLQLVGLIIKNTQRLEEEIKQRAQILSGALAETFLPPEVIPLVTRESGPALSPLLQKALAWTEEQLGENAIISERYGPIFYECSQFDEKPATHQFYFYVMKYRASEKLRPFIVMADRYYFIDIKKFFESASLAHLRITWKTLYELGHKYEMRSGTQPYVALDLGYWADLATIVDTKWRRPVLNGRAVVSQRSSMLDFLLRGLNYANRHFLIRQQVALRDHNIINPVFGLFVTRSYISLYYLLHNKSVWRLHDVELSKNTFSFYGDFCKTIDEVAADVSEEELKILIRGIRQFKGFHELYRKAFG